MTTLWFGCIGSRAAPAKHLQLMNELGKCIASDDNFVVSGNCTGSDQAYQNGANQVSPKKVKLFLPWNSYEKSAVVVGNITTTSVPTEGENLAEKYHPAWQYLSVGVKKLMCRNASIIMASDYIFAYLNHSAQGQGGTGHGWRIAAALERPCLDLSQVDLSDADISKVAQRLYDEAVEATGSKL